MGFRLDIALFEGITKELEKSYLQSRINAEALKAGARIVQDEMMATAIAGGSHPSLKTGKLLRSIKASGVRNSGNIQYITIGVHSGAPAFYAAWVEFGHGGPRPARPHGYVVNAFDSAKERAYAEIHRILQNAK